MWICSFNRAREEKKDTEPKIDPIESEIFMCYSQTHTQDSSIVISCKQIAVLFLLMLK